MKINIGNRYFTVIGVCILLGIVFHWYDINEFPAFIHAWAQADHYSITLGFIDNGLNFFKPQTSVFNHQFPHWWKTTTETGITSVDFPIHHYIPAVIMEIIGVKAPIVSRLYILLYSMLGLFGVYKLTYHFSKHHLRSLFVMVFAATSPIFIYYQAGFFPSIPSLANTILGVYFYVLFLDQSKNKHFYISILLLTLAALSRTTFVVPLVAVFCNEFLRVILKDTSWKTKVLPVVLSIGSILGYFFFNKYLRETYSSIFIGYLLPPESLSGLWTLIKDVFANWFWQYLSPLQYSFIGALILGWILFHNKKDRPSYGIWLKRLLMIWIFGLFLFSIAMSHAFKNHDYYFLDTYYLPVILMVSIGCAYFPTITNLKIKKYSNIIATILLVSFGVSAYKNQIKRRKYNQYDTQTFTKVSYEGSNAFLTELGVAKDAKILAIDICSPNVAFVMMDRRGHAVFDMTVENFNNVFTWDFDYVVTQNGYFMERTYSKYPDILKHLEVIGNNGRITVSKYHKDEIDQSLDNYIFKGLPDPFYSNIHNYDQGASDEWSNSDRSEDLSNGDYVGELKPDEPYGITLKEKGISKLAEKSCMFRLTAKIKMAKGLKSKIAIEVKEKNLTRFNVLYELSEYMDESKIGTWQNIEIMTMLPVLNYKERNTLALFLWNPEKDHLFIDDFKVELY